jgi:GTP cyclohydrolase I
MSIREKTDSKLGQAIHQYLLDLGVETPTDSDYLLTPDNQKIEEITIKMTDILTTLGLDLTDDSLADTPARVAKMFVNDLFWGLKTENFPKCTTVENKMKYDEMVLEKSCKVMSCCEHHNQAIFGHAHVAYIPKNRVLGLSKMPRIVEYFSRRPQIQERLTEQVYHALSYVLDTEDVAVVIDAVHMCCRARGIEDQNSHTITSKLGGKFKSEPELRAEFMSLIR